MTTSAVAPSSLTQRIISAVIGVPILVGICIWGEIPFVVLTIVLALVARSEIMRAYAHLGLKPNGLLSLMGALMPAAVLLLPLPLGSRIPATPLPVILILACGLVAASLWETGEASHTEEIHTGRNMAYGLLCGTYVSLFGGVALLRVCHWEGPAGIVPGLANGAGLVLLTAACTMAGDSAAFFVGKAAGKHKLSEILSPKKTTEGLAGGMVGSLLVGGLLGYLFLGSVPFGLLVGLTAGILGPMGDLFKSALKREIGIKDFGSIIPGHGGVLDRFDSLLFTAPVVVILVMTYGSWH